VSERREWSFAVRILVLLAGTAGGLVAGFFAALDGAFSACEGSPAYDNGGVSEAWICREVPRPLLTGVEWLLSLVALFAPAVGAAASALACRVIWLVVGLITGATAYGLEHLVTQGQVPRVS